MNIGFDAKRAFYNHRGLGSYSRSVIKGLIDQFKGERYFLYSPKMVGQQSFSHGIDWPQNVSIRHESHFSNTVWRTFQLGKQLRKDQIDIYHGLSNELPVGHRTNTKWVVTIHDLIFIKHPEFYPLFDRRLYQWKVSRAIEKANAIITPSHHTKNDLIEHYQLEPEKISVIAPICADEFFTESEPEDLEAIRVKYSLPKNYLLFVGGASANKNLDLLLSALELTEQQYPLVVVGKNQKPGVERKQTHFLSNLTNQELSGLYQLATATIFISHYEGFGLPIIESLANHTPVIASNTSAIPEAVGPGGLLINPTNKQEIADAIDQLMSDTALNERLANAGHNHVQQFRTDVKCRELMKLYQEMID